MAEISSTHRAAHNALEESLAPFHEEMQRLATMEQDIRIKRAIVKAVAAHEVAARASELKVSTEVASKAAALCW